MNGKVHKLSLNTAIVLCLAVSIGLLTACPAKGADYIELLGKSDGKYNKHGWNHYGPGYFTLDRDSGVLTSHDGMGLFWYSGKMFGDFVLELEFKCDDKATNSGIFVRIPYVPVSNQYIYDSFELQIYDAAMDKIKHVMHEGAEAPDPKDSDMIHATGAVYDAEPPKKLASKGPNQWNQYKITCQGLNVIVEINGEKVNEWQFKPAGKVATCWPKGYIGLQNHDATSSVHFRNIRIKEL